MSTKGYSWSWSEKAKQKQSEKLKEICSRPEMKKKHKEWAKRAMNLSEVKEKCSRSATERWLDPKKRKVLKEAMNRLEVKEKKSESAKKTMNRPEVREATSKRMKEYANRVEVRETVSKRQKEFTNRPEIKEAISERNRKRWASLSHEEKLIATLPARMAIKFVSKGEATLYKTVRRYYPTAEGSQWIAGYQTDIVLPEFKINVEYDGAYWHQNPEKDKIRDEFLQKLGWAILRVKESEEFDINMLHELVKLRSEHGQDTRLQRTGSC